MAYKLGQTEGNGLLARCDFCDQITYAASQGEITVDGSAEAWADFQRGAFERPGTELGLDPGDELAQRASDLKHYITLGANVHLDGCALLDNARTVLARMRSSGTAKGLKTWDIMLVWLRAQNNSPERTLDDSEIEKLFLERAKRATDELDRLSGVSNILGKQIAIYEEDRVLDHDAQARAEAAEGIDEDDMAEYEKEQEEMREGIKGVYAAQDFLKRRIADLGGTRKEQRAAERARIKAEKAAAKAAAKNAKP
jgi:hypothetical protein